MQEFKYLAGYSDSVLSRVKTLIDENRLGVYLLNKYPAAHAIKTDKALYDFTIALKNEFLQKSRLVYCIYQNRCNEKSR